jgi:hypothetical protein
MLTPIPPRGIENVAIKIAALFVVGGLIGAGVYFFSQDNTSEITNEKPQSQQPITIEQPEETKEKSASTTEKEAVSEIKRTKRHRISKNTETTTKVDTSSSLSVEETVPEKRKLEVFDPTRENDANSAQENTDSGAATEVSSSIAVETDNTNKKYTFHYQFKSDKLLLYGSFEKNLYEILEFFSDDKRTVFLFYKESYYLLNENSEKVKPLVPITDAELLKKLKEYREK